MSGWIKSDAPALYWNSVSIDGTNALASASNGGGVIYYSENSGLNWHSSGSPSTNYVASIVSGSHAIAVTQSDTTYGILYSDNYGRSNWTSANGAPINTSYNGADFDGQYGVAVVDRNGTNVYYSTDYGHNWNAYSLEGYSPVSVSISGTNIIFGIFLGDNPSLIRASINTETGINTEPITIGPVGGYTFVVSADHYGGNGIAANYYAGFTSVWYTSDYGVTWTQPSSGLGNPSNWGISSVSGNNALLCGTGTGINYPYISNDGGATWAVAATPQNTDWSAVAVSGNSYIAAARETNNEYIYISSPGISNNNGSLEIAYSQFSAPCFLDITTLKMQDGTDKQAKDIIEGDILFPNRKVVKKIVTDNIIPEENNEPYLIPENHFGKGLPSADVVLSGFHSIIFSSIQEPKYLLKIQAFKLLEEKYKLIIDKPLKYYNFIVHDGGYIFSHDLPLETMEPE